MSREDGSIRKLVDLYLKLLMTLHLMMAIVGTITDQNARIIEYKYSNDGQGNYELWVEQSDGITLWQTGRLMHTEDNKTYIQVTGGHLYTDEEYKVRRIVSFVADQNGYRPTVGEVVLEVPSIPSRIPLRLASGATG